MEGAEIRLAISKMFSPNDAHDARIIAGPNLTNRSEFPVNSLFVFKNAEACGLRFDLPVGCLEFPYGARLRIDVRCNPGDFRTDEVEVIPGVGAHRIANPRDANGRMNSILAFRHDVPPLPRVGQGEFMTATGASHLHDDRSICRRETHRRIWFNHLFLNRGESGAGAIRSRLSTRELNPDVRQPKTVSDSPLGRHGTSRGDTAVVHAHAAVHKDHVKIGLSIIQLKNCLIVLALVASGASLD